MTNRFNNYEEAKLARINESFRRSYVENDFNRLVNDVLESIADPGNEFILLYVRDIDDFYYAVQLCNFKGTIFYPFSKEDYPDKTQLISCILLCLKEKGIPVNDDVALKSKVTKIDCFED